MNHKHKLVINTKTGRVNQKKKRWLRLLILVPIIMLALITALNGYVKSSVQERIITEEAAAALDVDCILILGAGVWDNNRPSPMLEDRLVQGIRLYNMKASNRLLMSGDHGRETYDEVNVMKQFAVSRGVPSEHIFMDHAGFSTYDSLYRARDIFEAERLLIVTQKYHLYRALYVAGKLRLDAYGVASDPRRYMGQGMRDLREVLARVKDFIYVMLEREPAFLGEAIPVSGNGDITNDEYLAPFKVNIQRPIGGQ